MCNGKMLIGIRGMFSFFILLSCASSHLKKDIAEGMAYLHSKATINGKLKIEVFHQDLKPAK